MDTIRSGSYSGSRPWRIRRPSRPGSEGVAEREPASLGAASPVDLPRVVPVAVDVPEPGAADGVMVAAGLAAAVGVARVEVVGVEARLAVGSAVVVVGAEGRPEVADADATAVRQGVLTL